MPPFVKKLLSPLLLSYLGALVCLLLFERLADEIREGDTLQFDNAVRDFVHHLASPTLTSIMLAFTHLGDMPSVFVMTAAVCGILFRRGKRRGAALMATTVAGAVLLMFLLKLVFQRQRPNPYFDIPKPPDLSFPSGHALVAFCFWGLLAVIVSTEQRNLLSRVAIWCAAVFLVIGIGLSRIYLGVHFPSDVVGGYLAAIVWISGVGWVYRHFRHRPAP